MKVGAIVDRPVDLSSETSKQLLNRLRFHKGMMGDRPVLFGDA
jgi:hypothetical protein